MPDIIITFKNAAAIKLFTDHHGYQDKIMQDGVEIDNPETRQQFAKRTIKRQTQEAILVQKRKALVDAIIVIEEGEIE